MTIRLASIAALAAVVLSTAACDPCAGVADCNGPPRVSFSGRMIEHATGAPVAGVEVDYIRRAGQELFHDSVSVTTGEDGYFHLVLDAVHAGHKVIGDLRVRPPGRSPYIIAGVENAVTERMGEGRDLGRLAVDPFLLYVGELHNRFTGDRLAGASVQFVPTGGVAVTAKSDHDGTDPYGRFFFDLTAKENGIIRADLVVSHPSLNFPARIPVEVRTSVMESSVFDVYSYYAGTWMNYVGEAFWEDTQERITSGLQVEFKRTGGVQVDPEVFTGSSMRDWPGGFPVKLYPLQRGDVIGTLTLRPPAPAPEMVIPNYVLHPMDFDGPTVVGPFYLKRTP